MIPMTWLIWIIVAYACGSIPFGVLIARTKGVDIRSVGSGNIGATNVGRILGKKFGIACFILDALKGGIPVLLAGITQQTLGETLATLSVANAWWWLGTAVAAILGHSFSPWLGFKGGKGVATAFGSMLAMWPVMGIPAIIALLVWVVGLVATRMMSLASMIGAMALPIVILVDIFRRNATTSGLPFLLVTILLASFVVFRHRRNIARMHEGTRTKNLNSDRKAQRLPNDPPQEIGTINLCEDPPLSDVAFARDCHSFQASKTNLLSFGSTCAGTKLAESPSLPICATVEAASD